MAVLTTYAPPCIYMPMQLDVFQVLADPTRRRIIEALVAGEQQVGDLVRRAGIHQSGVSRHLRILSESSFVSMRQDGQRHLYSLKPEPFNELNQWLSQYRELWDQRLDRFELALKKKQEARQARENNESKKGK